VLLRKIFLQFFHNLSTLARIWCIRIVLKKNCRWNNCGIIVETFNQFHPRVMTGTSSSSTTGPQDVAVRNSISRERERDRERKSERKRERKRERERERE
jgi:hypothetical protein